MCGPKCYMSNTNRVSDELSPVTASTQVPIVCPNVPFQQPPQTHLEGTFSLFVVRSVIIQIQIIPIPFLLPLYFVSSSLLSFSFFFFFLIIILKSLLLKLITFISALTNTCIYKIYTHRYSAKFNAIRYLNWTTGPIESSKN